MASHRLRSGKTRRTYAERTVAAISDIRKRNPRAPIHLKTLKAQIQRNADMQEDLLGPYWRKRVNTTCQDLSDRGILDSQHPPGFIKLTSDGNRRIERTRQSIGLSKDHEHSPSCRENIGRKVIRGLTGSPSTSRRRSPAKETSRMTKADLLATHKKLQCEFEAFKDNTSRKLAELNAQLESKDDELLEYQDKLSGFDSSEWDYEDTTLIQDDTYDAIASLNNQKSKNLQNGDVTIEAERSQPTFLLPQASRIETLNNENIASRSSLQPLPKHISSALIRTKSGSFISSISKQPTPAPSDNGMDSAPGSPQNDFMEIEDAIAGKRVEIERGTTIMDFNAFEDGTSASSTSSLDPDTTLLDNCDMLRTPSTSRIGIQNFTPVPSPSPPLVLRRNASDADANRKRIERLVDEKQEARIEFEKKLHAKDALLMEQEAKIHVLETRLAERARLENDLQVVSEQRNNAEGECKTLQKEKMEHQWTIENLKCQLKDKSSDMLGVQTLLEQSNREVQRLLDALKSEQTRSTDLVEQLGEATRLLQNSEASREALQVRLDTAEAETEGVRSTLQSVIHDLQISFEDIQHRETTLVQEVEESREDNAGLRIQLQASKEHADDTRARLTEAQTKLCTETMKKGRLEADLSAVNQAREALETSAAALRKELHDAQAELQTERESSQALHRCLGEAVVQRDALSVQLEAKHTEFVEAQNCLNRKVSELAHIQAQLAATQEAGRGVHIEKEALQAKLQESYERNTQLMQAFGELEEEIANWKEGYEKLKKVQMMEFEEMDKKVIKKRKRMSMPALTVNPAFDNSSGSASTVSKAF